MLKESADKGWSAWLQIVYVVAETRDTYAAIIYGGFANATDPIRLNKTRGIATLGVLQELAKLSLLLRPVDLEGTGAYFLGVCPTLEHERTNPPLRSGLG